MNDHVCKSCIKRSKVEKWYPFVSPTVVNESNCKFHPAMTNWRVMRTLKTIKTWSLDIPGATVSLASMAGGVCRMPVNMDGGHVHERTARAKLFDYEGPYLDLLVENGCLVHHPGTPTTLTVTALGDDTIRQYLLEQEIKKGTKTTADYLNKTRPDAGCGL